jgi:hypothetical protein
MLSRELDFIMKSVTLIRVKPDIMKKPTKTILRYRKVGERGSIGDGGGGVVWWWSGGEIWRGEGR